MDALQISRMPTVKEIRDLKIPKLEALISSNGGFHYWADLLDLKVKKQKLKITDRQIELKINEVMRSLDINRMPTSSEILEHEEYEHAYHNKIVRTGGYEVWARRLSLEFKDCETYMGKAYESIGLKILQERGYKVENMSTGHPFDLLVNDNVKIDVKSSKPHHYNGNRNHTFGIHKRYSSCDIYLFIALDEEGEIERQLVIPSAHLRVVTLCIGSNSKYNVYDKRYDFLNTYDSFYKSLKI